MYDKSKKSWSQRLKITKTTESNNTISTTASNCTESSATVTSTKQIHNTVAAAVATTRQTTVNTKRTQDSAYKANNFGRSQAQHYNTVTAMHLPTLQLSDYHIGNGGGGGGGGGGGNGNGGYEYLPSALSRSMKYAEPWIYGTVRGIPARPSYHHFMPQAPSSPGNYMQPLAVVICSCSEYLNGAKRDVKKASVCKKCKGSRLPLTPIGGTMRLPTGGMLAMSKLRSSGSATVRVVSTSKKARPTILDPQKDPYDLMRRTRLLSPEPGVAGGGSISSSRDTGNNTREKDKSRGRGKSESPVRGRSRKRGQFPTPSKKQNSGSGAVVEEPDCWLVESSDTLLNATGAITSSIGGEGNATRRSILRCNVNPYDLISLNQAPSNLNSGTAATPSTIRSKLSTPTSNNSSSSSSQNEFMPPNDDFNVADAALMEEAPPFAFNIPVGSTRINATSNNEAAQSIKATTTKAENKATVLRRENRTAGTANANVNISEEDASSSHDEEILGKRSYGNVQAIAGQRISLGGSKSTTKSLIKQNEDGRSYESIKVAETTKKSASSNSKQVKHLNSSSVSLSSQPKRPMRIRKSDSSESVESEAEHTLSNSAGSKSAPTALDGERMMLLTATPTQHIKSILKRPTSTTAESAAAIVSAKDQQTGLTGSAGTDSAKVMTPSNQRRINLMHMDTTISPPPTAKSQFYIPLPQARKKVQFRVEERIVHALESDTTSSDEANEAAEMQEHLFDEEDGISTDDANLQALKSTTNYEYYNRKREQQRLENAFETATAESKPNAKTHPIGPSTHLSLALPTQDALLAELQKYSDFVSQVIAQASSSSSNSNKKAVNDYDGYNVDGAAVEMHTEGGNATNSLYYEDISPITIGESSNKNGSTNSASSSLSSNKINTCSSQQQHCGNGDDNDNDDDDKIMSLGAAQMLLTPQNSKRSTHSSAIIKAAMAVTSSSTSLLPTIATNVQSLATTTTTTTEADGSMSHVIRCNKNDDYDDDDDGQSDAIKKNNENTNKNKDSRNTVGMESSDEDVYEDANDDNSYTTTLEHSVAFNTNAVPPADDSLKVKLGNFKYLKAEAQSATTYQRENTHISQENIFDIKANTTYQPLELKKHTIWYEILLCNKSQSEMLMGGNQCAAISLG
ncbi:serine-rich adhesin for platelets-like [Anastrepha obliqua]|uniref:serine-rich adhesin for platelets-like n=1 Tax=Anastrepha obliqua TaxID=95512 RepID=UPI00240A240E|nr:serine-rich adhesin for platelets-like [Anastrepha obliqua]